jgi:hypothetical protein
MPKIDIRGAVRCFMAAVTLLLTIALVAARGSRRISSILKSLHPREAVGNLWKTKPQNPATLRGNGLLNGKTVSGYNYVLPKIRVSNQLTSRREKLASHSALHSGRNRNQDEARRRKVQARQEPQVMSRASFIRSWATKAYPLVLHCNATIST